MKPTTDKNRASRFFEKTTKVGDCLEWTGCKDRDGYGWFIWSKGNQQYAHRAAFQLGGNVIPDGMQVLHTCDNPSCVLFSHLFLGTMEENMRDKVRKGRSKFGGVSKRDTCMRGHPIKGTTKKERACKICAKDRAAGLIGRLCDE